MSARILVQNNGSSGATHWIEKPVIRVGSDPHSDIVIPNAAIAPHALTVEFRQTGYRVYNRSAEPVYLGSRSLAPGQHAHWLDSDLLELADGVALALDADHDPTPAIRPLKTDYEDELETQIIGDNEADAHSMPPMPGSSAGSNLQPSGTFGKTMLQLAVIVFCILGGAGLIVREQLKQPVSLEGKAPAFGLVVEQAREPDSAISPDLVDQLQLAEAALVRGQRQLARLRYQQLYDQLSSTKQSSTSSFNAETAQIPASSLASPHQQIVQLIRHRLASIGP